MAKPAAKKTVIRKRRERKNIERGAAHIQSTFNNTIVTIIPYVCPPAPTNCRDTLGYTRIR